jgi:ornithine cyclodeaminase/alanine dehydrogenase-like protein (mu-crystallin family)
LCLCVFVVFSQELEMKVLIVNQSEVYKLLPMGECMEIMAGALKTLGRGDALNPLRRGLMLPDKKGLLAMMPAYMDDIKSMGLKVISVFPGNEGTEFDSHMGTVLLFETEHGSLSAIIDASSITAIRTAAVSGVATQLLARNDARSLAILGSGVQARTHLEAMLVARKIGRVRVWSRNYKNARLFASNESERFGVEVEPVSYAREAVDGADIICTTTAAPEPIVMGDWLSPGAHVNVVGSSLPFAREVDTRAIVRSRLFVDRLESALNEAGDFLIPKQEGAVGDDHIRGEIGEILLGQVAGRESAEEITMFKSLGIGVEDIASAYHIYHKALEKSLGTWIELGGSRNF